MVIIFEILIDFLKVYEMKSLRIFLFDFVVLGFYGFFVYIGMEFIYVVIGIL